MPFAVVTGANKPDGIGFEVAKQLGLKGYHVIITSRNLENGNAAVDLLKSEFKVSEASCVQLDISESASIHVAAENIKKISGGALDVLVHNAGAPISKEKNDIVTEAMKAGKPISTVPGVTMFDLTISEMQNVFASNVFGVVELTNALKDALSKAEAPRVVFVSSGRGSHKAMNDYDNFPGLLQYSASKSALNMVGIAYAKELKTLNPKAKANLVCPGYVSTSFNGYTGFRTVQQGAETIVYAATISDDGPNGAYLGSYEPYGAPGKPGSLDW